MHTDEALYDEAKAGSKAAFAMLYQRYERPLFGFIVRRVGNPQDAEEIFHEAMLSILRTPTMTFAKGGFAGWLYKVAFHMTLNRIRKQQREVSALRNIIPLDTHSPAVEASKLQELATAAESLTPSLHEVYALRCAGKSYDEIASTLAVPVGTVKSRLHLMVTKLRKDLSK